MNKFEPGDYVVWLENSDHTKGWAKYLGNGPFKVYKIPKNNSFHMSNRHIRLKANPISVTRRTYHIWDESWFEKEDEVAAFIRKGIKNGKRNKRSTLK
jgi:hypothetical protein